MEELRKCTKNAIKLADIPADNRIEQPTNGRLEGHFYSFLGWGETFRLARQPLICLLYQARMTDDDECGAVGGMRMGRGNRSTRRKPAIVSLCRQQIPHDLTWTRTLGRGVEKPATNRLSYGTAV
jgi:hypothetical protein